MRPENGHIDTLAINDELEDLMREGWSRTGVADKITLHIGDARVESVLLPLRDGLNVIRKL